MPLPSVPGPKPETDAAPLVSVVMACRNERRAILDSVMSVLSQTHRHLELIVVDDGSTDGTPAVVRAVRDPRLRLIEQPPTGACAARNRGLQDAQGELVQILDADDLLGPEKIERQVARWRVDGNDYVYFGPFAYFQHEIDAARFIPRENWRDMDGHAWLVSAWREGGMMTPHSWLTPAALIQRAGPWDTRLLQSQDGEFFSRVLLASAGVRYCEGATSYYRVVAKDSISARSDHAARASRLQATELIADRLLAQDAGAATRAACGNAYEELMFLTYPQYPDLYRAARHRLEAVGGSDGSRPFRGPLFKAAARALGWRLTRRIQRQWRLLMRSLGLRKQRYY